MAASESTLYGERADVLGLCDALYDISGASQTQHALMDNFFKN